MLESEKYWEQIKKQAKVICVTADPRNTIAEKRPYRPPKSRPPVIIDKLKEHKLVDKCDLIGGGCSE